jgi:ribonuclease R
VTVRLVEAAPVAGALRFELLSQGRPGGGRRRTPRSQVAPKGNASKESGAKRAGNRKRRQRSKGR